MGLAVSQAVGCRIPGAVARIPSQAISSGICVGNSDTETSSVIIQFPLPISPYVSRLSEQCGILNILQPYRPPRPVTGIALL
jgi:hypothetical protein